MRIRQSMRDGRFYMQFRCEYCGTEHPLKIGHYDVGGHDELEVLAETGIVIEVISEDQTGLFKD